jgi:hypothetical protein
LRQPAQPIETLDSREIQKPSPQTRYSQPLPSSTSGGLDGRVVVATFIGKGRTKRPGFAFLNAAGKRTEVEATRETVANESPRGFFQCLGTLWAGAHR